MNEGKRKLEIAQVLSALPGWQAEPDRQAIRRNLKFTDFREAFAFMTRLALYAEKVDHHPELTNVYNRVEVVLSSHDAGGITQRDVDMAAFVDEIAGR